MFEYAHLAGEPLFYLFIALSFLLGAGYFWGKRINDRIFRSAFSDLVAVVKPVDQTFTNIGGLIGYHATLRPPKSAPVERVDATITFLPRHAWLWMPVSKLIRKYDRLFITIHLRRAPIAEGHLIERVMPASGDPKSPMSTACSPKQCAGAIWISSSTSATKRSGRDSGIS